MKRSFLFALSAAALLATSCDDTGVDDGGKGGVETTYGKAVSFTSIIGLYSSRAIGSNFENNDVIGVYAYDQEGVMLQNKDGVKYNNVKYKYDNDIFKYDVNSSDNQIKTTGETICYVATSPYIDGDLPTDFTIATDQSTYEGYNSADLLIARATESCNSNTPILRFWHKLSNVKVVLEGDSGSVEIAKISVSAKNNVACDIENNTYAATGSATDITPYKSGATEYLTIVAPQTFAAGTQVLSLEDSNGTTYGFTPAEDLELKSGEQTTITITIIGNAVSFRYETNAIGEWTGVKEMTGDTASLYSCDLANFKSGSDMVLIPADKWVVTSNGNDSPSTTDFANFNATLAELQKKNSTIELEFKGIKSIPEGAIKSDSPITAITSLTSDATEIADNAFSACSAVVSISFPDVEVIGDNAFSGFDLITTAEFPKLISLGSSVFCPEFIQLSAATLDGVTLSSIASDTFANTASVDLRLGFSNKGMVSYADGHKLTIGGESYTFKSITDPSGIQFQEGYSLAQIDATHIPTEDEWIITDENSDNSYSKAQFKGLILALVEIWETDRARRVTLNFKNIKHFPANAFGNATLATDYGQRTSSYSLIADELLAPEAIEVGTAAFKYSSFINVELPSLQILGNTAFGFLQTQKVRTINIATNPGVFLKTVGGPGVFTKSQGTVNVILGAANTPENGVTVTNNSISAGGGTANLNIASVTIMSE